MQKNLCAVLFLIFGLACKESRSQTNVLNDSTKINRMLVELHQLAESNLDSALELSKIIQQKAAQLNDQEGVWKARIEQGIVLYGLGNPDSARSVINHVLQETQKQSNRLLQIKAHLGLAQIYQQSYNFQSSIENLIQAEKLLKSEDPFDLRFDILNKLGIIHRLMKDNTSSLKYFNILETNYFENLDTKQKFSLFLNKGNVFADLKEYDKTEEWFKKAYEEIKNYNSPVNQAFITYNLGALFYRQKKYTEALEYISKSLEANLKIGDRVKTERCYRVLGSISFDQKEYNKAKKYFEMAMGIAKKINNSNAIMSNYDNLYQTYWNIGYFSRNIENLDKALSFYQKYNMIKDSLYKIETTAKVLELEKQYETEKKNTQITLLEKENQHKEDQILVQKTQRNQLIIAIVLVTGILGVFVYFFYYYKKVNKLLRLQRKRILKQKSQISEQRNELQKSLKTQNKLFSIIAHDLRSPLASIFNISSLIGFYIEDKDYDGLDTIKIMLDQKTEQILDLTDNLLSWARTQTENLKPLFVALSLNEIFNECIELYQPIAADKSITIDRLEQKDLLIWADRNMVKTICRNLVNNAVKFTSENGQINIWHEPKGQFALISIKDSGIGIEKDRIDSLFEMSYEKATWGTSGEKSTGLGLSVCKEFVAAMNGKIWVKSEKNVGSCFTVELQLYNPEIHH
jgi:signal transduction histidine kinase